MTTYVYEQDQATEDARKILSKRSVRFVYFQTLQVVGKAMAELCNYRWATN